MSSTSQRKPGSGAQKSHKASARIPSTRRSIDQRRGATIGALPASRDRMPTFYDRVYVLVDLIPKGKVTTYGAIAETLGMKSSSRMVGQALGALPDGSGVPAQRVINRLGALSGAHKFGGYSKMRSMLEREGITFRGELVNMDRHFWHPRELE